MGARIVGRASARRSDWRSEARTTWVVGLRRVGGSVAAATGSPTVGVGTKVLKWWVNPRAGARNHPPYGC